MTDVASVTIRALGRAKPTSRRRVGLATLLLFDSENAPLQGYCKSAGGMFMLPIQAREEPHAPALSHATRT